MCDYCGCRLQPTIDELSNEHDRLLDLVYGPRRDAERGDREAVLATLEHTVSPLLRHHTDKEERGLFTQLRHVWHTDARLDALIGEHHDIEALLAAALEDGDDWQQAVRALGGALAEHIFDEETDLFPYAVYELAPAQWDAVEDVHRSAVTPVGAGAGR